ncbi:MAG: alanine racemase [Spirochaetales bacterium]
MRATRALIRLDHFDHNIAQIRARVGSERLLCLAVKADAYGHGIVEIGRAAASAGVDYLAVATVDEGVELRYASIDLPILLYSLATPGEMQAVVSNGITPILSDRNQINDYNNEARSQGAELPVHMKIDTGMGRIGCRPEHAVELARAVVDADALTLGGVSTHFAGADMEDTAYTKRQMRRFEEAVEAIREAGIEPGIVHAANSGGVLGHPDSWYDMVRPGILAYGYAPAAEQTGIVEVRPVMELVSQVVFIKEVRAGESISYGMTWTAPSTTHIGTVPAGYGDGYNRLLSNRGEVSIAGVRYKIVGRVCMDQFMVDLGPVLSVERYQEVTLFGSEAGAPDAAELAELCETIPYEITCNVSKRVPRIYLENR